MPEVRIKGTNVNDYRFHCYAPGDGTLTFTWMTKKNGDSDGHLIVTREDVDDYLASNEDYKNKYSVFVKNGYYHLVRKVKRTSDNTVEIDGQQYKYELKGITNLKEIDYIPPGSINVFFVSEEETYETKNINMIAVIKFFLLHEEELTRQIA